MIFSRYPRNHASKSRQNLFSQFSTYTVRVAGIVLVGIINTRSIISLYNSFFQLNIVIGILIAYLSNYFIGGAADGNWRFMLGVESIPAALFVILIFFVPRSPRWLILKKGLVEEAKQVLKEIDPDTVEENVVLIMSNNENHNKEGFKEFVSGKFKIPIMLAFLIAFFNQLSGINAVIYYSPRIFAETGMGESSALLSSVGVGVVNLIATFIGIFLIDKMGRRPLLLIGTAGISLSLLICSYGFDQATYQLSEDQIGRFEFSNANALLPLSDKIYSNDVTFKNKLKTILGNQTYSKNSYKL